MQCTEDNCAFNCCGYCQRIGAIQDQIELGIPDPDGCYAYTEKVLYED